MRSVGRFSKFLGYAIALAAVLCVSVAQAKVNKAVVRAVRGNADISMDKGATWKAARVGAQVGANSIIRTGEASTVDLFLGDNGPVVRVTASTSMGIDKLDSEDTGVDKVIETQLDLKNGRILGNVKKLASASKYEVKTPVGVAGIRGTEYDISSNGTVHVVSGVVTVVYVDLTTGAVSTATGTAGQTIYPPKTSGGNPIVVPTSSLPIGDQALVIIIIPPAPTTTTGTTGDNGGPPVVIQPTEPVNTPHGTD